jgi:SSS family solute:Na+ symporter
MQFAILLIGALLFAFYSFYPAPVNFNDGAYNEFKAGMPELAAPIEQRYHRLHTQYEAQTTALALQRNRHNQDAIQPMVDELKHTQQQINILRDSVHSQLLQHEYSADRTDTNYVFLYFVKHTLPKGLVGLLFAVIFLASWGSISAALNSLASSSLMDIQLLGKEAVTDDKKQLVLGRLHTLGWGIFCIAVATFATRMGSLIEAVNILGSLFYGTILGIFLVAFYLKRAGGNAVYIAALIAEACVIIIYNMEIVSFLWLNVIGAALVFGIAMLTVKRKET